MGGNSLSPSAALAVVAMLVASLTGCQTDCAGIGIEFLTPPGDTTVQLGQTFMTSAGVGGKCDGGPQHLDSRLFTWVPQDTSIVSVAFLDSSHALVTGRQVGDTQLEVLLSGLAWRSIHVSVR
jgi:hypothetical protein